MRCATVSVHGSDAVKRGYEYCKGRCYRGIYDHGKRLGQLEVVLDDPQTIYNGRTCEWVSVSYIDAKRVPDVIHQLRLLGFDGETVIEYDEEVV